jgi:hypothetical protein
VSSDSCPGIVCRQWNSLHNTSASDLYRRVIIFYLVRLFASDPAVENWKKVRFKVLTAASMRMTALWDIAPSRIVHLHRRFTSTYCLHHQDDNNHIAAADHFETGHNFLPVHLYLITHTKSNKHWTWRVTHLGTGQTSRPGVTKLL